MKFIIIPYWCTTVGKIWKETEWEWKIIIYFSGIIALKKYACKFPIHYFLMGNKYVLGKNPGRFLSLKGFSNSLYNPILFLNKRNFLPSRFISKTYYTKDSDSIIQYFLSIRNNGVYDFFIRTHDEKTTELRFGISAYVL